MKRTVALVLVSVLGTAVVTSQTVTGPSVPNTEAVHAAAPASLTENALYTVGNMGATQLYYTYLLLGMIGDSFSKGVYDQKTALSLAEEVKSLTSLSQKSLVKLSAEKDLSPDDKDLIANMNSAFNALLGQATGLTAFVNGKNDGTEFQSYRQSAWEKIRKIIGAEGMNASP